MMDNKRNLYRLLQVQPDAPEEIIRASYRTLMQKLRMHPDLGGDESNAALLNQAYKTLTNKHKRMVYDQQLKSRLRKLRNQATDTRSQAPQNEAGVRFSKCPFCQTRQSGFNRNTHNPSCSSCRSPLQLQAKSHLQGQGKRSIHRIPHNSKINIVTAWPQNNTYTASIDDLSPNGLQLRCQLNLAPEQILKLYNNKLQAIGKVVRCQPENSRGVYRLGVEFVTLRFENKTGSFLSEKT